MESKSLLFGIIGFILGGLIVSIAATVSSDTNKSETSSQSGHSMSMASSDTLSKKSGADFDKAFLQQMIEHHEGAIEMAELAGDRAEHNEIKLFSLNILATQSKEVEALESLQQRWGYTSANE